MGIEIERKFLVINDHWKEKVISEARMRQGYLANQKNASVRVRIGGEKAHLNIKSGTLGVRRLEFEYEIPVSDAESILDEIALRPCVEKTRYKVKHGDHVWELDVFSGENDGLVVAEIELNNESEQFERPDWAGDEVSDDRRYYNIYLVEHPFSQWPDKEKHRFNNT